MSARPRPLAAWSLHQVCNPPTLERLEWALSRAAVPCPPLSASGQLEHTDRTALAAPPHAILVAYQSAMKGRG